MKSLKSYLIATALFAAGSALLGYGLAGCASVMEQLEERPMTSQLIVKFATLKVIGDDVERAERVLEIATAARTQLSDSASPTVALLEAAARKRIDWSRLDAADTILVELLLTEVRTRLEEKLGDDILPPEQRLAADTVLSWIADTAQSAARAQPYESTLHLPSAAPPGVLSAFGPSAVADGNNFSLTTPTLQATVHQDPAAGPLQARRSILAPDSSFRASAVC